jgi:tetratricopeptide (TPR) repeat protein
MATGPETQALAWTAFQSGNLHEAERLYREALRQAPGNADLWCMVGIVCRAAGKVAAAVASYREALRLRPGFLEALNNLANALVVQGKPEEAVPIYQQVLRQRPDYTQAHNNLGAALRNLGQLEEAAACYRHALRLQPIYADAHNNLGDVLDKLGKSSEAAPCYREALRLRPAFPEAHTNLGVVLVKLGKIEEAIAHHRQALSLKPDYAEAHSNLGNALLAQDKLAEAAACYEQALRLRPDFPEALANLGIAFAQQRKLDEAIASYQRALQLRPNYPEALGNLGNVLLEQGKPEEALQRYQEALRLKPDYHDAHFNSGQADLTQGRMDEALTKFDRALAGRTDYPEAHMGRAVTWLMLGNYEQGWKEYEWRWKTKEFSPLPYTQPVWDGTPLQGRTILVHAEQGLGDTIQLIRYAPLVKQAGGTVIVACPKALRRLFAPCAGIDRLVEQETELPAFDVHASLLSLPRILGTTVATIPARVPYLFAEPELVEYWRRELSTYTGFRIGIAWQGNPQFGGDRHRSFPLAHFEALARVPGVRLLSLQKNHGLDQLRELGDRFPIIDLGPRLDEKGAFLDTAAVMKNLDLVVCPNTSLVHLAGALAVPIWLPLARAPEWRWLWGREDSPWYPTARVFRQEGPGEWDPVFARMATELASRVKSAAQMRGVSIAVSPGELLDKITILEIKAERFTDPAKLRNVRVELAQLVAAREGAMQGSPELERWTAELKAVNETLWQIEDDIRRCENKQDFGPSFVTLARAVYRNNDRRSEIKRHINELLGSHLVEEKGYTAHKSSQPV